MSSAAGTPEDRELTPGCYKKQFSRTMSSKSDVSEESKDDGATDKKGSKANKKDSRYYAHMEGGSSEEELVDTKSKSKKSTKVFSKLKDRSSKEEKKEEKQKSKLKSKGSIKEKESTAAASFSPVATGAAYCGPTAAVRPVFGVPLAEAVRNSPCHDGVPIPVVFRLCIEYVTEHGLQQEGIYRISTPKSTLDELRYRVDHRREPTFPDAYAAAALLKLFLRELPEPILTFDLTDAFESAFDTCKNKVEWLGRLSDLVERLPACNRSVLAYLFAHVDEVLQMHEHNKMSVPAIGLVLQPTLNISQRLLSCFMEHWRLLFAKVTIKRYVSPIRPSRFSQEFPSGIRGIEEELSKQESLLKCLHADLAAEGEDPKKTEELWDVVRIITQLKRELKRLKKEDPGSSRQMASGDEKLQGPCLEMFEEKQLLAVQMQLREQIEAEQKAIDDYRRIILALESKSTAESIDKGDVNENVAIETISVEEHSEDEWQTRYQELEEQRDRLIASIIDERYKCAHLRACIEMITLSKQKEHDEATRL